MYADLNVPWPQNEAKAVKLLTFAQLLGYNVIAFTVKENSVKAAKLMLATSLTANTLNLLKLKFPKLKILRRVTLVLDESSTHPNISQLCSEPNGCDILAVHPHTEKHLQTCATSLDIDLICVDVSGRLPYPLRHKLVGAAIKRGVKFEICHNVDRPQLLRHVIANFALLVRASRNRGVVVSSGASLETGMRAPLDIVNLLNLWGLPMNSARDSVSKNACEAATQGVLRLRSTKQAIIAPLDTLQSSDVPATKRQKVK